MPPPSEPQQAPRATTTALSLAAGAGGLTPDEAEILGWFRADPATDGAPIDVAPVDIETAADADRALARVARLDRELAAARQLTKDRIDSAKAWLEQREAAIEPHRQRHLWAAEHYARRAGRKTTELPSGTLRLRPAPAPGKVVATGEPPADAPDHLVKVSRSWSKADIKQHCKPGGVITDPDPSIVPDGSTAHPAIDTETGEIVPGVVFLIADALNFTYQAGGGR